MKNIFFFAFLLFGQNFFLFGQIKVEFKTGKTTPLKSPADHLYLAGDFNEWRPAAIEWQMKADSDGGYRLVKNLPKGMYNFKITRGSWDKVECGINGTGIENRTLVLAHDTSITVEVAAWQDNFKTMEKQHTATAQVQIISNDFEMPQLGKKRRVWIYLPAGYASSTAKYPVIYMQDGQNLFDAFTSGYGEWGIDELMEKLSPEKQCIIVGIDHGGESRITEYDPYDSKYGKGRGNDYVEFLTKTLKPFIDAHYRVKTTPRHTTIAGSSMGALIAMYATLKYPDVYGNAGIFSPAFWMAPGIYDMAKHNKMNSNSRFYFVCGDAESNSMVGDMQKMANILQENGTKPANAPVTIIKGASHNEHQWNGDWPDFYNWLFKP